jgi:hypothetical protein
MAVRKILCRWDKDRINYSYKNKDDPPAWLPQEKWEDILALSVLPGPLDSLCVNFAQNSESWKSWYKSQHPEKEPLPLAVAGESSG